MVKATPQITGGTHRSHISEAALCQHNILDSSGPDWSPSVVSVRLMYGDSNRL